jgi:hypothetical protein
MKSHKNRSPRDRGLQASENKALSRGIIRKSAPTLAEITIRKSQLIIVYRLYVTRAVGATFGAPWLDLRVQP